MEEEAQGGSSVIIALFLYSREVNRLGISSFLHRFPHLCAFVFLIVPLCIFSHCAIELIKSAQVVCTDLVNYFRPESVGEEIKKQQTNKRDYSK